MKYSCVAFCIVLATLLFGCSDNDDLENKWQLRQYEYEDGSVERVDNLFFNFQKNSFSAICVVAEGAYETFLGNYNADGDKLSIMLLQDNIEGDVYSAFLGWEEGKRTYNIEKLTSSSLRLKYENVILDFRKY